MMRDAERPALARRLAVDPAPVLAALAPPFALTWWPRDVDEALLQADGLGQVQGFEYDDGALWAATSKVTALRALGVRLEPDRVAWAAKARGIEFEEDLRRAARRGRRAPVEVALVALVAEALAPTDA